MLFHNLWLVKSSERQLKGKRPTFLKKKNSNDCVKETWRRVSGIPSELSFSRSSRNSNSRLVWGGIWKKKTKHTTFLSLFFLWGFSNFLFFIFWTMISQNNLLFCPFFQDLEPKPRQPVRTANGLPSEKRVRTHECLLAYPVEIIRHGGDPP